jgi:PHD/YefM family antitoxin component YafN of YafNO toxin-antitoxin module
MDTLNLEEARTMLDKLLAKSAEENWQFRITSDQGNVVVLPEETYQNFMITLEVLSTPGLISSLMLENQEMEMSESELCHMSFQEN